MTRKQRVLSLLIIAFPFLAFAVSLFIGSWHIPPRDIVAVCVSSTFSTTVVVDEKGDFQIGMPDEYARRPSPLTIDTK